MTKNQQRIAMIAKNLRLLAVAAENATEFDHFKSIMAALDDIIGLVALCMFSRQKKLIQAAAHDFDKTEMGKTI